MIILSIVTAWLLVFIFKMFEKYNVEAMPAIVVNYLVCVSLSYLFAEKPLTHIVQQTYTPLALILGFNFFALFNFIAYATRTSGIAITAITTKLSLVITVVSGMIFLHDTFSVIQIVGFVLAIVAMVCICYNNNSANTKSNTAYWLIPLLMFLWNGINDSWFNVVQGKYVAQGEASNFSLCTFSGAFIIGFFTLIYTIVKQKIQLQIKHIIAGVILGVPNYYSLYFMVKALQQSSYSSGAVFTFINMGIVVLGALSGFIFFHEKLTKQMLLGMFLALMSLGLIMYGA